MDSDIFNKFLAYVELNGCQEELKIQIKEYKRQGELYRIQRLRELRAIKIKKMIKRNAWYTRDFGAGVILKRETKSEVFCALKAFELKRMGHENQASVHMYWGYFHKPRMQALGLMQSNITCEFGLKINKKDIV